LRKKSEINGFNPTRRACALPSGTGRGEDINQRREGKVMKTEIVVTFTSKFGVSRIAYLSPKLAIEGMKRFFDNEGAKDGIIQSVFERPRETYNLPELKS